MTISQQPFQLSVDHGHCFCIYRAPADVPLVGTVLHLPAFGDEMNKSRAMTASAARAFANRGYGVLQVDLTGCGDSSGDHSEATLACWVSDLRHAHGWLLAQANGATPPVLWSLRSGSLLIPPLLSSIGGATALLLWQPVLSGAQQVSHLLRQKVAADIAETSAARSAMRNLRKRWEAGEKLEIGGYYVSARLANELDKATFDLPAEFEGSVRWMEIGPSSPPRLSPAAEAKIAELRSRGVVVEASALAGPGFWQSAEIERCDGLIGESAPILDTIYDALRRDTADV